MKLIKAQISNFRSIEDSGEFEIGDITCLVGKNEAGKTAILKAIEGIKPISGFAYDRTRDYPRRYLSKFDEKHPEGKSVVATTTWILEDNDVLSLEAKLGKGAVKSKDCILKSYIGGDSTLVIEIDEKECLNSLIAKHSIPPKDRAIFESAGNIKKAIEVLNSQEEKSENISALLAELSGFRDQSARLTAFDKVWGLMPHFFYTSHFERMSGEVSLNKVFDDKKRSKVEIGDKIFLDFLEYAGTTIEELRDAARYEDLVAQCEGASNDITDEIFEFWSQNEALAVKIEINEGRPEDKPPFNSGRIAKARIENKHHRASLPLSERSAGFVWFFSFLSQFKQLKKTAGKSILLLDEPGLTLHGKAQSDLLRYIESRLLPDHQVIYTTHSPFMVPAQRLADVRVVEDIVEHKPRSRPVVKGTKVSSEILSVDKDTIFPLQAHLGYEITQSLFIGKHCVLVEGPSDILYLQILSQELIKRGRTGLDSRWTICPTGGLDKIISFASLFSGNKLDVAVFCDYGKGDKSKVERLRQSQILRTGRVLTAAEFSGKPESDIEDLFDSNLYCQLVNKAFSLSEDNCITQELLTRLSGTLLHCVQHITS